jgi:hypothetical protein
VECWESKAAWHASSYSAVRQLGNPVLLHHGSLSFYELGADLVILCCFTMEACVFVSIPLARHQAGIRTMRLSGDRTSATLDQCYLCDLGDRSPAIHQTATMLHKLPQLSTTAECTPHVWILVSMVVHAVTSAKSTSCPQTNGQRIWLACKPLASLTVVSYRRGRIRQDDSARPSAHPAACTPASPIW